MNPTFNVRTINGQRYQLLTLPGTNLFTHRIINNMGAHLEKAFFHKHNKTVYGISHLVEHLGFRATPDYTTDVLMSLLKKEGTYNASTDHDMIDYFFKTSMDRRKLASRIVCNYAFNRLDGISTEEFDIEKSVVVNEINRYADDPHTMFYWNADIPLSGYHNEDNVLGIADTVNNFTLSDAKQIKKIFLAQQHIHAITYDPLMASEDEIIGTIDAELCRWNDVIYHPANEWETLSNSLIVPPQVSGEYEIDSDSKQHMVSMKFESNTTPLSQLIATYYLGTNAKTSLTDVIREKYGLTYGIYFYNSTNHGKQYTTLACDIEVEKVDILMNAIIESINTSVDNYTPVEHTETISAHKLQRVLRYAAPEAHNALHTLAYKSPNIFDKYKDGYSIDVIAAHDLRLDQEATFQITREQLRSFKEMVNNKEYSIVTNKK